jgi:hypothetical protein
LIQNFWWTLVLMIKTTYKTSRIELLFVTYRQKGKDPSLLWICCQTSMFINSRMATIEKYRDVQVYSGKMSRYSVIFRHIPWYSAIFRDIPVYSAKFRYIPWYSGILGFHNALIWKPDCPANSTRFGMNFSCVYIWEKFIPLAGKILLFWYILLFWQ